MVLSTPESDYSKEADESDAGGELSCIESREEVVVIHILYLRELYRVCENCLSSMG